MRTLPILALAAALANPLPAGAQSAPPPERATLAVRGTATVERRPDTAHLALTVRTRGQALDATVRDHRIRVGKAALVLGRFKPEGVTVDRGDFALGEEPPPARPDGRPGDGPPTYAADTRFDLAMPIGTELDAVVAGIASSGLFELGQIRFSVSDEAAAIDDARRAAMVDAKHQAQLYADAAGVRLDAIDRIADGTADSPGQGTFDLPMRAKAAAPSVGITAPGALSYAGSVTVVWRIVPR